MIGKCFTGGLGSQYAIILEAGRNDSFNGVVVYVHPRTHANSSVKSRIGNFHNWTFYSYTEIPKEEFLKAYKQAIQEQVLSIEAAL